MLRGPVGDVGSCTRNANLPSSRDPVSPRPQEEAEDEGRRGSRTPCPRRGGTPRVPGASSSLVWFTFPGGRLAAAASRRARAALAAKVRRGVAPRSPRLQLGASLHGSRTGTDGGGLAPHPPRGGRAP
jgi:hypothetical protein